MQMNAEVASKKIEIRRSSPLQEGEGSMDSRNLTNTAIHFGGVVAMARWHDGTMARWHDGTMARWQGYAKQLEKPSSSRCEITGAVGTITGEPGKCAEDERVADGSVVAMKPGNAGGAKGPCCL
jgi:hypothetical protein